MESKDPNQSIPILGFTYLEWNKPIENMEKVATKSYILDKGGRPIREEISGPRVLK